MARVLVVDDERKLRRAFVLFLREDNHETESAASLDEAIAAIEQGDKEDKPYDVVVTDALPEQGGVSRMRTVGERWPEIELILATDERALEGAISAVRGGAHSYLSKPVTANKLRRAVASAAEFKAERETERRQLREREAQRGELLRQIEALALENEELCLQLADFGIDRAPAPLPKTEPEPEPEEDLELDEELDPEGGALPASAKRILVVDDERTLRRVFSMFLSDDGLDVETADDVEQGIAALERNAAAGTPFSVVVSDISMPGRNGTALMKEVAARWPEIKLIVVTGEPTVETAALAVTTRAYEYMYKPVSSWLIRKVVANALTAKAAEDERRQHVVKVREELAALEQRLEARTREQAELRAMLEQARAQG